MSWIAPSAKDTATATDIKPLEIVFFMRSVASKNFFEQMKGRGVRVVSDTEMEQVNRSQRAKSRTTFAMVKTASRRHTCAVRTTSFNRKCAAELGMGEEEALKRVMGAKAQEFVEKGAEVYAKV